VCEYLSSRTKINSAKPQLSEFKETAIREFGLTEAEVLMLLNLAPQIEAEVPIIIDQCDDRLSEEQIERLISSLHASTT